jgi:RNA polymerase sigma factor (sigma-70 family)
MNISNSSAYAGVDPGQTPHILAYVAKGSLIGITADTPDIFLVVAAKDGDHQAYAELCRRHSKQIRRTILRITRDVADAEDTLQETLLKAYVHIGRFEGRSAFSSWLTRIAINSALMLSRKKRSHYVYSLEGGVDGDDFKLPEPAETAHNPEESCILNALENECVRAIRHLSPTLRVVVQIRYREDASVAQIREDAGYLRISGKIASSARQIENPRASRKEAISALWNRSESFGRVFKRSSDLSKRCRMSERYCILCVDDDVSDLEARAVLLEEGGYSVTAVSCTLRALEYDVTKFHLAVLDFSMPALNRFQLLLHLRAAHASFPIVLLSGMSRELPNDMRIMFSSCLDKGELIPILLNARRSLLALSPDPLAYRITDNDARPLYRRHGL